MSALFVAFTELVSGATIEVNALDPEISDLRAAPASILPTGVANGTIIGYSDGRQTYVRGTVASVIAALTGGGLAPSTAIYVDGGTGNDATGARGTPTLPFLTMAAALAVAQSGDEVLITPGFTYTGAFSLPAVANLIIRGGGEFTGETVLTAANNADVCTLNAANRSILFDTLSVVGVGTGRPVVGTGATAAGAWLSTGGLNIRDCVLTASGAGVNALSLTNAGLVSLVDTVISVGTATFVTCSSVVYADTTHAGALAFSWDNTDANKPTAGQSTGFQLLAGSVVTGTTTLGGQARIFTQSGTWLGPLTALNLSVAAGPVSPKVTIGGSVGAVDFNTTTAALPSAVLGAFEVSFAGASFTGAAYTFRVASGATAQPINMVGVTCPQAATFTSDALCALNMRGAALTSPTYASANTGALGIGTIVPPYLAMSAINIAAGGAIATNFTGGFTAPAGAIAVVSQSNTGGASLAASCSTTQVTITSTAQAGNTAAAYIVWP